MSEPAVAGSIRSVRAGDALLAVAAAGFVLAVFLPWRSPQTDPGEIHMGGGGTSIAEQLAISVVVLGLVLWGAIRTRAREKPAGRSAAFVLTLVASVPAVVVVSVGLFGQAAQPGGPCPDVPVSPGNGGPRCLTNDYATGPGLIGVPVAVVALWAFALTRKITEQSSAPPSCCTDASPEPGEPM